MAQADYFLKIDGIEGESDDKSNPKELQISSWSFGATNAGSSGIGGGMGTGKVSLQDFHFVVQNSKASANLFLACASGEHIGEAILTCRKPTGKDGGQVPYLVVTFNDIVVSSYQTGGSDGSGTLPMDQISFNFTKIKMETKIQDAKGIVKSGGIAGWDTKKNQKV
jgi:type VI secretion system secreted protein Hcp